MITVSVLMTTYVRESAAHLQAAIESIFSQSTAPTEFVLVLDGPVGLDQTEVIYRYAVDARIPIKHIVPLATNGGLAAALNVGLRQCTGDYIMRMDSDDISLPDRLRRQLDYVAEHPEVDVVSSWAEEITDSGRLRFKFSPTVHAAVVKALRWRNILVHPTLLAKASALRSVGGYRSDFGLLEDYDLYVRLAQAGARFHVLPIVLLRMRTTQQADRRGGVAYCLKELRFRRTLRRIGFISTGEFIATTALYTGFRLISGRMRRRLYDLVRRERAAGDAVKGGAAPAA